MTSLRSAVLAFAGALNGAWDAVRALAAEMQPQDPDSFMADWFQSAWEMLVEAAAARGGSPVFLEVYEEGADCDPRSSRVYKAEALPTHTVKCVAFGSEVPTDALTGQRIHLPGGGVPLDRLVSVTDAGWYAENPPFDHALLLVDGQETVIPVQHLDFILAAKEDSMSA